jgi:eukaryotic-like serine/threonine-protein kinase
MDAGDASRVIGGRYECVELIGRGGMGEVWRARDTLLQRDVAVKRLAYGDGAGDEVTVGRSLREARLAARLNHPNAVAIYDVVVDEGLPCLVMELVSGRSLKEVIAQQGRLDPVAAARIGRQVAAALGVAHRAGIVHRDVKPANVLIASDGTAKLTDFGIARDEGDAGLTSTGTFIGTPNFLAPEIALGGNHSPASDVWALGALLYAAVEGEPPYAAGGNALAILNRIATSDAPAPTHAGPLSDLIIHAMRRNPAQRPSAATVVQLLDDVIDGERRPADRSEPALRQAPSGHPPPGRPATPAHTPPPAQTPPPHTPPPHTPLPYGNTPQPPYTPPPVTAPPAYVSAPPHFGPPPPPPRYPSEPPPRQGGGRRRTWFLAGGGLLAVAAIVSVVVVVTAGKKHSAAPTLTPTDQSTFVLPTLPTQPTTTGTSTGNATCDDPRTDGQGPAVTYVIFAELFDVAGAQACTKPGTVPESFTRGLTGKVFTPTFDGSSDDQAPVVKTHFTAIDGTKLLITCTKGEDGKYLVTDAQRE